MPKVFCAIVALVGLLPLLAVPAEAQRPRRGGLEPGVSTAEVALERVSERIAAVGSSRARRHVTVTTRVAGVIEDILFEGGVMVEAGQALVRLTSEPEAIAVETALAQREQAAATVERYQQLDTAAISRVARAEAETALKIADAAVRKAREELDRMTIRAPFSGVMGLTSLNPGDYLAVGSPIASLDDRTALIIEFTVPEAVAPSIRKDLPVRANLIARSGEVHEGKVHAVGTRIDPTSRTLTVWAEIPNPHLRLIPGSTFSVSVNLPSASAPVIPGHAVQWDRRGAFVWRIRPDSTVERIDVAILSRDGDRVQVDAALEAGQRVVFEGGDVLYPGQRVRLLDDGPPATAVRSRPAPRQLAED